MSGRIFFILQVVFQGLLQRPIVDAVLDDSDSVELVLLGRAQLLQYFHLNQFAS